MIMGTQMTKASARRMFTRYAARERTRAALARAEAAHWTGADDLRRNLEALADGHDAQAQAYEERLLAVQDEAPQA